MEAYQFMKQEIFCLEIWFLLKAVLFVKFTYLLVQLQISFILR